jgi:hypothetical protein
MLNDQNLAYKWLPVSFTPPNADLEVSVLDGCELRALLFPVRKSETEWVDISTNKRIDIVPTHWRQWSENR